MIDLLKVATVEIPILDVFLSLFTASMVFYLAGRYNKKDCRKCKNLEEE